MSVSESGASVAPHLRVLRLAGFCRLPARAPPAARALHAAYRVFTLAATITFTVQEVIYVYQWRRDVERLSRVLFLLLCNITSFVKQVTFFVAADDIDLLIAQLDDPLYNQSGASARALLASTARSAGQLLRAYAGTAVVTCVLWIVFPILGYLQGHTVEFPFWTGFQYQHVSRFLPVLIYSFYATTLVGIANTTMDAFMATILYQCTTQLRILRTNLELLPEAVDREARRGGAGYDYEATLKRLFTECLTHYNKICRTVEMVVDIFGLALIIQFAIGGWVICMAAYNIIELHVLSVEFLSMVLFISCILTELFLYCYYGNEVTFESGLLLVSLYAMRWTRTPLRFQRSLVLAMERAKRPLRPVACHLVPLSLDTFVTILKSSYSFYAVLRSTK